MQHVSLSLPPQKRKSAGGLPKKSPHLWPPPFSATSARFCFRRSSISNTQTCWRPFTLLPVARGGSARCEVPPRSHQKRIIPSPRQTANEAKGNIRFSEIHGHQGKAERKQPRSSFPRSPFTPLFNSIQKPVSGGAGVRFLS